VDGKGGGVCEEENSVQWKFVRTIVQREVEERSMRTYSVTLPQARRSESICPLE
jgi:hypothetical protein